MAATAYKANNTSDKEIAKALTSGFSGQLKGWWEFYLTEENRQTILNAKKTKPIKVESTSATRMLIEEEDAVATLVYTITKSFIGNPEDSRERASEILSNLTCPKLQDFQWYKDMFLTKVMLRIDSQKGYWKERFLVGLPKLFAEKIKTIVNKECSVYQETGDRGLKECLRVRKG